MTLPYTTPDLSHAAQRQRHRAGRVGHARTTTTRCRSSLRGRGSLGDRRRRPALPRLPRRLLRPQLRPPAPRHARGRRAGQLDRLTLTSRAFHHDQLGPFCRDLAALAGMDMVLPMNTGAEAVETAVKVARKWGYDVKGVPRRPGHHHRGRGQLPRPDHDDRQLLHRPACPGGLRALHPRLPDRAVRRRRRAARRPIDETTVAVLIEPIQGEAGVRIPPAGYLPAVREICTERRRAADRRRDPVRARPDRLDVRLRARGRRARRLRARQGARRRRSSRSPPWSPAARSSACCTPGTHGSTFGGNPLASAVGPPSSRLLETGESQAAGQRAGRASAAGLEALVGGRVAGVRRRGLWAGVDIDPALMTGREACERLLARGVLVKDTHGSTIRLAPPLVIAGRRPRLDGRTSSRASSRQLTGHGQACRPQLRRRPGGAAGTARRRRSRRAGARSRARRSARSRPSRRRRSGARPPSVRSSRANVRSPIRWRSASRAIAPRS